MIMSLNIFKLMIVASIACFAVASEPNENDESYESYNSYYNQNNYETLVDKTTLELENFIKRNDPDSKIQ